MQGPADIWWTLREASFAIAGLWREWEGEGDLTDIFVPLASRESRPLIRLGFLCQIQSEFFGVSGQVGPGKN
ncbi:hypothetical protein, partial [Pandoraea cepalis]|uniref:hypothetical protein n=1 Tax=Pandoraea cepalis TaxID=2508294 RepID=UPI001C2CECC1